MHIIITHVKQQESIVQIKVPITRHVAACKHFAVPTVSLNQLSQSLSLLPPVSHPPLLFILSSQWRETFTWIPAVPSGGHLLTLVAPSGGQQLGLVAALRLSKTGCTARKMALFIIIQDRQTQVQAGDAMATTITID